MHCPVCANAAAEDITRYISDGRTFRCPECGEFTVVGSVYDVGSLKALDPAKRKEALARAKLHSLRATDHVSSLTICSSEFSRQLIRWDYQFPYFQLLVTQR